GPLAQSDGHDSPGLIDELVPRHTAVVDEIVVRFEDAVRQPVVTQELPEVFDRIEAPKPAGAPGVPTHAAAWAAARSRCGLCESGNAGSAREHPRCDRGRFSAALPPR